MSDAVANLWHPEGKLVVKLFYPNRRGATFDDIAKDARHECKMMTSVRRAVFKIASDLPSISIPDCYQVLVDVDANIIAVRCRLVLIMIFVVMAYCLP